MTLQKSGSRAPYLTWRVIVGALAVLAVAAVIALCLIPGALVYVEQAPDRFARIFQARGNEYVFLLGVLFIGATQFRRKQWLRVAISLGIGTLWLVFSESLVFWLEGLGADSFSEAQDFDWHEALFFITTLPSIFSPIFPYRRLLIYIVLAAVLLWALDRAARALGFSRKQFLRAQGIAGMVILALPLINIARTALKSAVDNTALYRETEQNFNHTVAPVAFDRPLKVVVYIGESTSAMNFGVYGYPRATTPQLQRLRNENPGFLLFDNVFSTFTHTSQSLLETLSIGLDRAENVLPVMSRQRVSLVDLLATSHVPTFLFSNQGETGTWNMASRIIFRKAERVYSVNTGAAGNADFKIPRPYDLDFFKPQLESVFSKLPAASPAAIFLHSYAGHGTVDGYLGALPPDFRGKVDDYFSNRIPVQIFGDVVNQPLVTKLTEGAEEYDAAMRYVDFAISDVIAQLARVNEPVVYIYFADHGESSFTASGHESSRFKLEMGRVPFVMYFNDAARTKYPALYSKYRTFAEGKAMSTLAQIPATVIDLLGGEAQAARELPGLTGVVGDPAVVMPPVLVRSSAAGDTFVSLANVESVAAPRAKGGAISNAADDATRVYVARQTRTLAPTLLCYGSANTLATAMRGAFAGDCIGLALAPSDDKTFTTWLGERQPPGPDLASVLRIAAPGRTSLWVDSSKANLPQTCDPLANALAADGQASARVVALSAGAPAPGTPIMTCAAQLRARGLRVAMQIPTGALLACASGTAASPEVCRNLDTEIAATLSAGVVTDIAYEHRGEAGVRKLSAVSGLPHTITGVIARDLARIEPGRFRMVVVAPQDVNVVR